MKTVYPDASETEPDMLVGERRARLEALGPVVVHHGRPADDAEFLERVGDASAVLLGWDLPVAVLRRAPRLELVSFTGIGVGNYVDLAVAREQGITVCNTPGYADDTVAEHTFALLLAVARRVAAHDRRTRAGGWNGEDEGMQLGGKTLGLVGLGGIARRTAALGRAFGMRVLAWTRRPSPERAAACGVELVALDELLAASDVVSVHVALAPETEGLLSRDRLALMAPHAVLVNTARGEVVDEDALVDALEAGRIRGAGLDVYATEPLPAGHRLAGLDNVVLTPHVGYATPEARASIYDIGVDNIVAFYRGQPVNVVAAP